MTNNEETTVPLDKIMFGVSKPNQSCKRCHGRGYEGWNTDGKSVLCSCLRKPNKYGFIEYGEFIKISTARKPE